MKKWEDALFIVNKKKRKKVKKRKKKEIEKSRGNTTSLQINNHQIFIYKILKEELIVAS